MLNAKGIHFWRRRNVNPWLQWRPYVTPFPFGRLTKPSDKGWRESEARKQKRKTSQGRQGQGEPQRPAADKERQALATAPYHPTSLVQFWPFVNPRLFPFWAPCNLLLAPQGASYAFSTLLEIKQTCWDFHSACHQNHFFTQQLFSYFGFSVNSQLFRKRSIRIIYTAWSGSLGREENHAKL